MAVLKYISESTLNPLKKNEFKVFYLNQMVLWYIHLMPSSTIEVANRTVSEFSFTHGTIDEDSLTACNKVSLKTVRGTYQEFTLVSNCN